MIELLTGLILWVDPEAQRVCSREFVRQLIFKSRGITESVALNTESIIL